MKRLLFLISVSTLLSIGTLSLSAQTESFITDSMDSYIRQGIKDWSIPGLAIVIIKDGKIVIMKGYGVRDLESQKPVDSNTLFMIASNTKLFTATALSELNDQHKLSLDDKFTKYFPDYKLYDNTSTKLLTVRDLLTHRIGTKTFQGDFTFWNSNLTRAQIMYKMRLLKPSRPFRKDFGYCNSCFMSAGEIIPKVTKQSWEKYVQDSLLNVLQMTHSTSVSAGMEKMENVAQPYTNNFTADLTRVPYDQWDNLGPAASIISNVNDLSHWLMFQLDSGRYDGRQVLPFSVLQQTRDVNIILSSRKSNGLPMHFIGYGLGVFAGDYNGKQIYWHTGGAGGMVSNVCFVPEERLGIAILTNNDNQGFFEALRYQVLDAYLGVKYVNRSHQALGGFHRERVKQLGEMEEWKARVKNNKPVLPLSSYAGEYKNELYGSMMMTTAADHLKLKFNGHANLTATMKYLNNGEWLLQYDNILYGIFVVKFKVKGKNIQSIDISASDFVEYDPYTFTKIK